MTVTRTNRPTVGDEPPSAASAVVWPAPPAGSFRDSGLTVGLCVLLALVVRAPFVNGPLAQDEAGLLMIAQQWDEGAGPFLYGDYFVGRPMLLLLFYLLADAVAGGLGPRLLACVLVVLLVVVAGWVGHQLRGRAGAGWAALVAAAFGSNYSMGSMGMNGRLMGAALVVAACGCTLAAVRHERPRPRYTFAVLAGVAACSAVLTLQSFIDGLAFAVVLLLACAATRLLTAGPALRIAAAGMAGIMMPLAALAVGVWTTWMTTEQLWFQMFGFRMDAMDVLTSGDMERSMDRLVTLVLVAVCTGVGLLLVLTLVGWFDLRRVGGLGAVWVAVLAMLAAVVFGMYASGDYWLDYMLQLLPAMVVAVAMLAPARSWRGSAMKLGVVAAALSAVVGTYLGLRNPILGTSDNEAAVGRWIAAESRPGDTAFVAWGKANVVHESGMTSPYPYLWSLLTRTLDPDLELILQTLRGPDAPTWVVEWYDFNSWDLDESGELADVIDERYVYVGNPCGRDVYLLKSEWRQVPPPNACADLLD